MASILQKYLEARSGPSIIQTWERYLKEEGTDVSIFNISKVALVQIYPEVFRSPIRMWRFGLWRVCESYLNSEQELLRQWITILRKLGPNQRNLSIYYLQAFDWKQIVSDFGWRLSIKEFFEFHVGMLSIRENTKERATLSLMHIDILRLQTANLLYTPIRWIPANCVENCPTNELSTHLVVFPQISLHFTIIHQVFDVQKYEALRTGNQSQPWTTLIATILHALIHSRHY